MQELIKVTTNTVGTQVVSARELYDYLEPKTKFPDWCIRMFEYGFEEGKDFISILGKSTGGRPSVDYALTIDTAKEIAMLQRSEKGKQARQYFIECERKLKDSVRPLTQIEVLLQSVQLLADIERRQSVVEAKQLEQDQRIALVEAKSITRPEYFTVMGYASLQNVKIGLTLAAQIGKKAKAICEEKGYNIDKIHDPRFGQVGCYPSDVLRKAFSETTF